MIHKQSSLINYVEASYTILRKRHTINFTHNKFNIFVTSSVIQMSPNYFATIIRTKDVLNTPTPHRRC